MATYYVKLAADGGNDSLAGTSPSTAWATLQKALGATGIASGDTLYIAPGTYIESVVIGGTYSASTFIIGDPLATYFPGMTAAPVRHSNLNAAQTAVSISAILLSGTGKSNLKFSNIHWYGGQLSANGYHLVSLLTGASNSFDKCVFESTSNFNRTLVCTPPTSSALNLSVTNCIFMGGGGNPSVDLTGSNVADTTIIRNCLIYRMSWFCTITNLGAKVTNCTSSTPEGNFLVLNTGSLTYPTTVTNCLITNSLRFLYNAGTNGMLTENYNRVLGGAVNVNLSGASLGANSVYAGGSGIESGYSLLVGLNNPEVFGSFLTSPNASFGNATNAAATDIYGVTWTGANPDSGSATYRVITSVPSQIAYNGGVERNASTITIAPGSTSQSIELYLGATGLTASTAGLSAWYNRTRTADVAITLVARTISQPWVAGGFAEVNATTMPGVYRLDIPNESISTGYVNTTIVVRGASGTNGAVVTIQEPQAVGTQLRMGPFTVQADGILTDERLKLIQGSVHSIDFKMVDAYGTGVDGTGTVVTAKVYNAAGFLVDTYTCTPMYALDGRYSFAIDSTVTNNVGMYTINISRQIGSEINVFGRMKLEVLSP